MYKFEGGSGHLQTLRGAIKKSTCGQQFNQFNEAKDNNYTDMTEM